MKPIIYILSFCLLLSSCYSYKHVDSNNHEFVVSKKYKIKTQEFDKIKGKIYSVNNDSIILMNKGIQTSIPVSKIEDVKQRKFSYLKTSGAIIYIGLAVYLASSWELSLGDGNIQSPN
ncbi:hypothetical protein [Mariniflexile sp.]|uniref:hypothetical protein n=1 Tax=Mariniflexile sp. TaxID=1979402 RepID=UPI00404723DF